MNKYSLRFKSDQLESRYQEEIRQAYIKIFRDLMLLYICIVSVPCIIIANINWNIADVITYSFSSVACFAFYIITKKFPRYYNIWVNSLNVLAIFGMGGQIFLYGPTTGVNDEYVLFFFGAAGFSLHITIAFLSANFLMTFSSIIIAVITYNAICWTDNIYAYKYGYSIFSVFIIRTIYIIQKNRREIFLLRDYEKEWAQIVKKGLTQSIITVKYNQKNNFITLDMVNDQARKLLSLQNSDEFKEFTRKTIVFDNFKDHEEDTVASKYEFRQQFTGNTLLQINNNDKLKNTLENRLISIIKQSIQKQKQNQPQLQASQKVSKTFIDFNLANSEYIQNTGCDSQVEDHFCGIFKKSNDSIEKKISIKASSFQNQANYYCCLVIEEETNKQKVKMLEGMNKHFEKTFFQLCVYIGDKLQNIVMNLNSDSVIKANIALCYNTIYNLRDHLSILKNQYKLKIDNFIQTKITLGQLKQLIQSRFIDKFHLIDLKIDFVNCSHDTHIISNIEKLNQVIMNLVENSIKFQQQNSVSKHRRNVPTTPLQLLTCQSNKYTKSQTLNYSNKFEQTRYDLEMKEILFSTYEQKEFKQEKDLKDTIVEDSQQNKQDSSQNKQDQQDTNTQQQIINFKEVCLKFELIKGEDDTSNIFKVSVQDFGRGMPNHKMLKMLETIGTKNPAYDREYQKYSHIGWKVNYHIIGNIGPFYNFYLKSKENQGLEYHFYVFQDIGILKDNNKQQLVFSNSSFQNYFDTSNNFYYHVNNILSLKEKVRKYNLEALTLRQSNIGLLSQNIKSSLITPNFKPEIQKQQSIISTINENESISISQDLTCSPQLLKKNIDYKFIANFHLQRCEQINHVSIKQTNNVY